MNLFEGINKHCINVGLKPNSKGYLSIAEDNLVTNFSNWTEIKKEFEAGQGGELNPNNNGEIKFAAIHSSSALCVNNFAEFKLKLANFSFYNYSNFISACFEKKLTTGISTPNLDFYLETSNEIIGFESKFTEILKKKKPNLNNNLDKYRQREELNYLPKEFTNLIEEYALNNNEMHLDVAQLLKHSIGLINRSRGNISHEKNPRTMKPVLVYIYWRPKNFFDFSIYDDHKKEIEAFEGKIKKFLDFIPISYPEFWQMYDADKIFANHINKVKNRYYQDI